MGRVQRLSEEQRQAIIDALRSGKSQNRVAREFGVAPSTVNRLAAASGLAYTPPKNAAAARHDYAAAERLSLLNEGFEKAREMLAGITKPSQLRDWAISVGTLIDKRRLEEGEATARTEVTSHGAREELARRIDELAARREARRAAG